MSKTAVWKRHAAHWQRNISTLPMLRTCRMLKSKLDAEAYLSVPHGGWNDRTLEGRRILTRLRFGCNELRVNIGRWEARPVAERVCRLCAEGVEDERHFLLHCPFLNEERMRLWHGVNAECSQSVHHIMRNDQPLIIDAFQWSDDECFTLLMGGHGMLPDIVAAKKERKARVLIMAALTKWMRRRAEELEWLDTCVEEEG
jgi:hypothetical protein